MDKGERYLWRNYVVESLMVMTLMIIIQFAPTLLVAYLTNHLTDYWFISTVWIVSIQLSYFNFVSYKQLQERLMHYNKLMQAVKDELDILNTEQSLIKEKEVGPN